MIIVILGLGSIGLRHFKNFSSIGFETYAVSSSQFGDNIFSNLETCLTKIKPDVFFICNETGGHKQILDQLATSGFGGGVLVEKPLFSSPSKTISYPFSFIKVSYQLRFNPLVDALRNELSGKKILNAMFYVGQYLPNWRSNRDYRESYSAHKILGGGALRDLSHELDLTIFLLGNFKNIVAKGGKTSSLEITSDDSFSLLASTENCEQVVVHMNYLNRTPERFILINTESHTFKVDFVKKEFTVDGISTILEYDANHDYLKLVDSVHRGKLDILTGYDEALHLLNVIEAAEQSSSENKWIAL
jgi:predicted dehydrogenase